VVYNDTVGTHSLMRSVFPRHPGERGTSAPALFAVGRPSRKVSVQVAKHSGATGAFKNAVLSRLRSSELSALRRFLEPVKLLVKAAIYELGQPTRHCYFPEVGMISVVSHMADGRCVEVGMVGREGMTGGTLAPEKLSPAFGYSVQIEGRGHRLSAVRLRELATPTSQLRSLIVRYENSFLSQTMHTAGCNGLHSVQQRCCRWLLMSRDRAASDEFKLTHDYLALMMGVRRASVSDVLSPLQKAGMVQSQRGLMKILDPKRLAATACECYERTKAGEGQLH